MSKTEDVRNKSLGMGLGSDGRWGGTTKSQQMPESDEAAMLQDRLALLNKQEFLRAKSTAEVISLLQKLQQEISSASSSVRASAHEVRGYPVEVVTQLSTRLEVCVARCEDAAKRASDLFSQSQSIHAQMNRYHLALLFTSSITTSLIITSLFVVVPKLF